METRRSSDCATKLAPDLFGMVQDGRRDGTDQPPKDVWKGLSGCSGNIISLMNADYPGIGISFMQEIMPLLFIWPAGIAA